MVWYLWENMQCSSIKQICRLSIITSDKLQFESCLKEKANLFMRLQQLKIWLAYSWFVKYNNYYLELLSSAFLSLVCFFLFAYS